MKKLLLLTILGLSLNLAAQMQVSELKFIFDKTSDFTEQFKDKENPKSLSFTIEGLNVPDDIQTLKNTITNARGVEQFKVQITPEGKIKAQLRVYKYATGFWYWKAFMETTGVPTFNIEGVDYDHKTITSVK